MSNMNRWNLKSSVLTRMILVLFLTIALLIPLLMVGALVSERQDRHQSAVLEVTDKWARAQALTGPILTIPLKRTGQPGDESDTTLIESLHILPDTLQVSGALFTEVRYRGIYDVVLYNAGLQVAGSVDLTAVPPEIWSGATPLWQEAYVTVGISDLRGIKDSVYMKWGDAHLQAEAGVRSGDVVTSGITFRTPLDPTINSNRFDLAISLNGSSDLSFAPVGRYTYVSMQSTWTSPSFTGAFLPDSRTVTDDGFTAEWTVLELNRTFPQSWVGNQFQVSPSDFGLSLLTPVDHYQKTMRSVKYAIMVIALTFLALFLSEVLIREILHPVQYALVGLALILFYLLLLSLSEYVGFDLAYLVSSVGVLLPVTLYAHAVLSQKRIAGLLGGLLVLVYAFFYILLRLEDYALLIGSLALLFVLSAVMYMTRKVNWFSIGEGS